MYYQISQNNYKATSVSTWISSLNVLIPPSPKRRPRLSTILRSFLKSAVCTVFSFRWLPTTISISGMVCPRDGSLLACTSWLSIPYAVQVERMMVEQVLVGGNNGSAPTARIGSIQGIKATAPGRTWVPRMPTRQELSSWRILGRKWSISGSNYIKYLKNTPPTGNNQVNGWHPTTSRRSRSHKKGGKRRTKICV